MCPQRLAQLRQEADNAVTRAEEAEAKNKKYEQLLLEKEQEITSLTHRISVLEGDLEKTETKLTETKATAQDAENSKSSNDALPRRRNVGSAWSVNATKSTSRSSPGFVLVVSSAMHMDVETVLELRKCRKRSGGRMKRRRSWSAGARTRRV